MEKVLVNLAELQKIDSHISEIQSLRGSLPQQVEKLEIKLESTASGLQAVKDDFESCTREHSSLDAQIKDENSKKEKYKAQLYEVKTNREYDAISMEIESVDLHVAEFENRILELMNKEESLSEEIKVKQADFDEIESEFKGKNENLQRLIAKTEKEEILLNDRREKMLSRIDKRILSTYNRIQSKYGNAIVPVVRRACGGCFKALPPQRVLEARKMNKLILCEVCGRILIWDEAQSESDV